jgi:hypothetical protein
MLQPGKANVQCQNHGQHKLEPGHRRGEPFDRDMLFNELLKLQFLQHGGHRQQAAVRRHI